MIHWQPYLNSIVKNYEKWWQVYTITDVAGKILPRQQQDILLDLMVETVKTDRENRQEKQEVTERLDILTGLRKYSLEVSNHVLLQGKPGSGKSTALARLLLEECDKLKGQIPFASTDIKITILVQLRYYKTSILDLIGQFLREHDISLEKSEIEDCLQQKHFFLLIDGINELPSNEATTELKQFRKLYKNVPMVFTTRELGLRGDLDIEKKLAMQPLNDSQMKQFVKGYLGNEGENLLKQLGNERLQRLGETPLLLLMLCSIYKSNQQELPKNLGETFRAFTKLHDDKLKADVRTQTNSKKLWADSLQYLAFTMTERKNEPAIFQAEAEEIIGEFLEKNNEENSLTRKRLWLEDLINHHLLQRKGENEIEFHHQMIQEYYAAEYLLQQLSSFNNSISDEKLQCHYLNYLKWTETIALMLGLVENEAQAVKIVKLALEIDWVLGARLAGEVKHQFQAKTIQLILELNLPQLLIVKLLDLTQSDAGIPSLIKALEDSRYDVRRSAENALDKIGSEAAISSLTKALEHSYIYVRNYAVYALGKIGSEAAILGLIKALEYFDDNVRSYAAYALSNIGSEAAIPGLIKALEHSDNAVRSSAADALGKIGSEVAIPSLIKALEEWDSSFRWIAADALRQIGSEATIPILRKALKDSNDNVRMVGLAALFNISLGKLYFVLGKVSQDPNDASLVIHINRKISIEEAIPILEKALEDPDYSIRISAATALGNIGTTEILLQLKQLLKNPAFLLINNGDTAIKTLEAIQKIQESDACKFYDPDAIIPIKQEISPNQLMQEQKPSNIQFIFNDKVNQPIINNDVKGDVIVNAEGDMIVNPPVKTPAEYAQEIQDLLKQLKQNQPSATETELVRQVIDNNPTLKIRLINALKQGGTETLKVFFPFVSIPLETIRGFLEVE